MPSTSRTTIHKLSGDPDDLAARKEAAFDPVVNGLAPEHGAIFTVTARAPDGLIVMNLWDSRSGAESFTRQPEVQAAQKASGLPMPSSFERYDGAQYTSLPSVARDPRSARHET